jgi:hypothetical protein
LRALVSNDFGNVLSNEAVLTVSANQAPTAAITLPAAGTTYAGGMVINYAGTGTDPEDGTLPAGAFTWRVDFHHDTHVHPFIADTSGAKSGSFTIPVTGETAANVWYRIYLTVADSSGATATVQRDILPRIARLTLATAPAGLQLRLDGQRSPRPRLRQRGRPRPRHRGDDAADVGRDGVRVRQLVGRRRCGTQHFHSGIGDDLHCGVSRVGRQQRRRPLGRIFSTATLTGSSVTRVDPAIDFVWGPPRPGWRSR